MRRYMLAFGLVTFLSCLFVFGVSSQQVEIIHLAPPTTGLVEGTIQKLDKTERFMVIEPGGLKIFYNAPQIKSLKKYETENDLKIGQPIIAEYNQSERIAATWRGAVGKKYIHRFARKIMIIPIEYPLESLITALKDEDRDIRRIAAKVLVGKKDPRVVEPLIAALKDESFYVRRKVAKGLGKIKDIRAVEPLIAALKDEDSAVRKYAAVTLGEIKDIRAVEPLIAALKDEDSAVREFTAYGLYRISGKRYGEDPKKWHEWWHENKGTFLKNR